MGLDVVPLVWYDTDFQHNLCFLPAEPRKPLVGDAAQCGLPLVLIAGGQRLYLNSKHLHF